MNKIYKQIQHRGQLKHMNKIKFPDLSLYKEIDLDNNNYLYLNIERPKETFYYEATSEEELCVRCDKVLGINELDYNLCNLCQHISEDEYKVLQEERNE